MTKITIIPILLLSLFSGLHLKAEEKSRINFGAGYGNYEGGFLNISWQYHKRNILSFGLGSENLLDNNNSYFSTFAKNSIVFNFSPKTKANYYKWGVGSSVLFWRFEDRYYRWNIASFISSFERRFQFGSRFNVILSAGASFQLVLKSERKTFEEVGWPYKIKPSASIQLNFKL